MAEIRAENAGRKPVRKRDIVNVRNAVDNLHVGIPLMVAWNYQGVIDTILANFYGTKLHLCRSRFSEGKYEQHYSEQQARHKSAIRSHFSFSFH